MSGIAVRPAVAGDAADIAAIYNDAVFNTTATFDIEPETVEERRAWLARDTTRLALVALADERVVGWASLVRWSARGAYDRTAEAAVYVAPQAHRAGVGLALGQATLARAASLGLHAVIAQICAENTGALALAERLGYERVGVLREVGFKFGRWLDVVVCEHRLERGATSDNIS